VRGNNLLEIRLVAFGDWIHSYLSPRQSVDSNPSSPDVASSTLAAFPVTPCNLDPIPSSVSATKTAGIQHRPLSLAMRKSAKPRSLTGILNTAASSVLFPQRPSSFIVPRWTPPRFFRSFFLPLNPPPIGTRERQRASRRGTWRNVVTARSPRHLRIPRGVRKSRASSPGALDDAVFQGRVIARYPDYSFCPLAN